jgi:hypothetical protein
MLTIFNSKDTVSSPFFLPNSKIDFRRRTAGLSGYNIILQNVIRKLHSWPSLSTIQTRHSNPPIIFADKTKQSNGHYTHKQCLLSQQFCIRSKWRLQQIRQHFTWSFFFAGGGWRPSIARSRTRTKYAHQHVVQTRNVELHQNPLHARQI